jgi:hypothetical protein
MALNTAGFLLEGIRVATANSPYTFPPRSFVSNQGSLDAMTGRAEYAVFVSGQNPDLPGIEIADPNLRFFWTRNNGTIVRFDWDAFAKRWSTMPGSGQEKLGKCSNSPRVAAPIPDRTVLATEAPYAIYVGSPDRVVTFNVVLVGSADDFTDPPAGTVQISADKGELNFGTADLADQVLADQPVYVARQSFFDRTKVKGRVGVLPTSSSANYDLWLNPIPGVGQTPRVRIGFRAHLTPVAVASEVDLSPAPAAGTFKYSLDTGKLAFADADIDAYAEFPVYYDGVMLGSFQLSRGTIGPPAAVWPDPVGTRSEFVGATDAQRFVVFCEPDGAPRYYFAVQFADADTISSGPPADGTAYLNTSTGQLYVSGSDPGVQTGALIHFVDTIAQVENGVSVQFYKSGLNISGEEVVPDFVDTYSVSAQTVADGIGSSPFVQLPTVPTVDSYMEWSVGQGTSGGTFTGSLVDANDPDKPGNGYILDLEMKQFKFSQRKTVAKLLDKATSVIKLDDSVVVPFGFEVVRNGTEIRPGVDFDFNQDVGLLEFIEPVGENDPGNSVGFSGTATNANRFDAVPGSFPTTSQAGKYLFVKTGANFGVYPILASAGSTTLFIQGPFPSPGAVGTADVRTTREVVADRFWKQFLPPFKKLKVYRSTSTSGPFGLLGTSEFSVLASTGQINLVVAAKPGEVFKAEYTSLDSEDEGVTVTPTARTDFAGFKIRQEIGQVVPNSGVINFNPDGKTVLPEHGITLYIDGITVPPEGYVFQAPGTLTVSQLLTAETGVTINYFVAESPGGNTFFTLLHTPIDVDFPLVTAGEAVTSYNGDQTGTLSPGSAILIDDKEVVLVGNAEYDAATDTTKVTFSPEPEVDSEGAALKACAPVTGAYLVGETAPVDVLTKGTNTVSLVGDLASSYAAGTILLVDEDPYYVVSSQYVPASNRTNVILAVNARRNYLIPSVKRTVRPVFNSQAEFKTQKALHAGYPLTLVRTGNVNKVLKSGVDYDSAEGGVIKMTSDLAFGDTVQAFYVARKEQPVGTSFSFNYAYQIAPNEINGIRGQKLVAKYHLANPDTFFYRVESIKTFIPEVVKELASSSGGSSGPSTSSVSSLATKDYGSASLYFDEQHYRNLDVVVARLLQFFNDQANYYEDMLADFDGRVVGGTSGRFRFNADVSGVKRNSYAEVQNDIDDQVKLYDGVVLVSFSPITFSEGPVYGPIWDYNALSRFYGTARPSVPVALNDKVTPILDFGKTMGSIGVSNLNSVSMLVTARSRSKFTTLDPAKLQLTLPGTNGDPKALVPPFYSGQKVKYYGPDGAETGSGEVVSVTSSTPAVVTVDTPVTTLFGSIMADTSDPNSDGVRFYREGDHISVDYENGQVSNAQLPPPFGPTEVMEGNEVMETNVTFINKDVTPKRIPALDGQELTDHGAVSFPPLTYKNELFLLSLESQADQSVTTCTVTGVTTVTNCFLPLQTGSVVKVTSGLNAGQVRVVQNFIPPSTFTVSTPFPFIDPTPQSIYQISPVTGDITSVVADIVGIVQTNAATAPVAPAFIGGLNSELKALENAVLSYGPNLVHRPSGTITAPDVLSDVGAGFLTLTTPVTNSCFLYVASGPNQGVYKIKEVTSNEIKVDTAAPFGAFPSVGLVSQDYYVVQPWPFVTKKQPEFAAEFIRSALAWVSASQAWVSGINAAGKPGRLAAISARIAEVNGFISRVQGLLKKDEKIYDTRYLWIKQRIDRKEGLVVKIGQAAAKRQESLEKLLSDQQKKLIASQIA